MFVFKQTSCRPISTVLNLCSWQLLGDPWGTPLRTVRAAVGASCLICFCYCERLDRNGTSLTRGRRRPQLQGCCVLWDVVPGPGRRRRASRPLRTHGTDPQAGRVAPSCHRLPPQRPDTPGTPSVLTRTPSAHAGGCMVWGSRPGSRPDPRRASASRPGSSSAHEADSEDRVSAAHA